MTFTFGLVFFFSQPTRNIWEETLLEGCLKNMSLILISENLSEKLEQIENTSERNKLQKERERERERERAMQTFSDKLLDTFQTQRTGRRTSRQDG